MLLLAVLTLGVSGCGRRNEFVPPPPPTVTVAQPTVRQVVEWVEFTGSTEAMARVELRTRVKGYLQEIEFEDGAFVNEGDLLFVIEKEPFLAALEAAEANLAKAQAATKLAQANLERTSQLVTEKAVSEQQLDVDTAELDTAKANERAAHANVTQAKLDLSYTEIRAPLDGRIGRHLIDKRNLVLPDQTVLAIVEQVAPIHAYFSVSERDLLRFMEMRRNDLLPDPEKKPPELFLSIANDDFAYVGRLDFREPGIDPATGTTMRRGIFDNESLDLLPGMFVRIRAALGDPRPRVLVEERAIGSNQRGDFVLVVNDQDIVEHRPVTLGVKTGGLRVVLDGLEKDEWIVVNGMQQARPGSPITRGQEIAAEADAEAPQETPDSTPAAETPSASDAAPSDAVPSDTVPAETPSAEAEVQPGAAAQCHLLGSGTARAVRFCVAQPDGERPGGLRRTATLAGPK